MTDLSFFISNFQYACCSIQKDGVYDSNLTVSIVVKWEKTDERLEIPADGLVYIGKEANNIEDQPLDVSKSRFSLMMTD
ncbi:hypothetical protein RSJ42_08255 [Methanosarcina hadiensis]|uniref:hypothetical protein n=1 Tax=Methanosarcina hadiensis TaxID=3078083 RepID=UPI0039777053